MEAGDEGCSAVDQVMCARRQQRHARTLLLLNMLEHIHFMPGSGVNGWRPFPWYWFREWPEQSN